MTSFLTIFVGPLLSWCSRHFWYTHVKGLGIQVHYSWTVKSYWSKAYSYWMLHCSVHLTLISCLQLCWYCSTIAQKLLDILFLLLNPVDGTVGTHALFSFFTQKHENDVFRLSLYGECFVESYMIAFSNVDDFWEILFCFVCYDFQTYPSLFKDL